MSWLAAIFLTFQGVVLSLVNLIVRDDYMDEIFHGPQARDYCRGAFLKWHPKITTFPGIYILGTLYGWARWAAQALLSHVSIDDACSTRFLRSLNVILSAVCLVILRELLTTYRQQTFQQPPLFVHVNHTATTTISNRSTPARSAAKQQRPTPPSTAASSSSEAISSDLHALILALYPLHWFFSFLYYTDVASLLFLLLAQLQVSKRHYFWAALAGGVAVLCRQTNAVWTAFLLGEAALAEVGMEWAALPVGRQLWRRGQVAAGCKDEDAAPEPAVAAAAAVGPASGPVSEVAVALGRVLRWRSELAARLWPLLLPPVGFGVFLVMNGGSVVLGDKEAHKVVRHGAQLFYFAGWAALMLWPQLLQSAGALLHHALRRRPAAAMGMAVAAVAATAAVAHVSTMVHPYMLADNRHYVFYLWRRVIGRTSTVKYALAPVYAVAWAALLAALHRRVTVPWIAGFIACVMAQLLPAWLLELRYFTPGFFLIALRLPPPSRLQAAAMLAMYGTINALTMYLFLNHPYEFADGSVARFIW